jgi:EpsI family protein
VKHQRASIGAESLVSGMLVVLLIAIGSAAWMLGLRATPEVDASTLRALPHEIPGWSAADLPLSPAIEEVLGADLNVQRVYQNRVGDLVWLYVGYYSTEAGGRPEHTPRGCYPAAGWTIQDARVLTADPDSGLRVNEYHVVQGTRERLVHFWYRSSRRTGLLGGWDQNVDRFLSRISNGRADGALIRISTPLESPDQIVSARGRLLSFATRLDPLIGRHWPTVEVSLARR